MRHDSRPGGWFAQPVLRQVTATASGLVLAALHPDQDAFNPQSLLARLVEPGASRSGGCVMALLDVAVGRQAEMLQLVTTLLQFVVSGGSSSSSSSSSSAAVESEAPGLAAAAAGEFSNMFKVRISKQPGTKAVAAVLAEPAQAQLLQQTLQRAVLHACGDDDAKVSSLAHVLQGVCDYAYAAVQPQVTSFLQELMQQALEQGNSSAAQAVAILFKAAPVQQQLLQHTAAVLQAAQPEAPQDVQAAAWQLLEAWVATDAGRAAVLQHDWLHILNVMTRQGSWLASESEAAAGFQPLCDSTPVYVHGRVFSAAKAAAGVIRKLNEDELGQFESDECVQKLLLCAVPPAPAPAGDSGSGSGCAASSTPAPADLAGTPGNGALSSNLSLAASSSSSSSSNNPSSKHSRWSIRVADTAFDVVLSIIHDSDEAFAAAARHVGLLLTAMRNTQYVDIATKAAQLALQIAEDDDAEHICTPPNVDRLLAVLQQPVHDRHSSAAVVAAAKILLYISHSDTGMQLLAQQGCYDALVRATQHQDDEVALHAAQTVMEVTQQAMWLLRDSSKTQQGQAAQQQLVAACCCCCCCCATSCSPTAASRAAAGAAACAGGCSNSNIVGSDTRAPALAHPAAGKSGAEPRACAASHHGVRLHRRQQQHACAAAGALQGCTAAGRAAAAAAGLCELADLEPARRAVS
ncbi:hypothetical protein COO60DRAFT_537709 [Scenedesmus sp. NREL 46B-D3]|nr:hypothetical protein COO60DRAFT_537709 [Scenedesmus sp. NREL 46B-D3]